MKIGRFEVFPLSDGTFKLDGGAMFGTVPKVLWCRHEPADESNRISLTLGSLLIKTPNGKNVLVDSGLSSKYERDPKFIKIYGVDRKITLGDELKTHGLAAADVDYVINTHLHFDHAGGDTQYDGGKIVPTFKKARYVIQKEEWEDANHPHERNAASYLEENFAPLGERKVLELVSGEHELEPGLSVVQTGGHCRGHQVALIRSEGQTAIYLGDLVPTRSHVPLPWVMGYDLFPLETLEIKRRLFERALKEDWTLIFDHDLRRRTAKLAMIDGRLVAKAEAAS